MSSGVVTSNPKIQGGVPCFAGTRVPAAAFFDYLRDGSTIEEFLADFPTVSRQQVEALIDQSEAVAERTAQTTDAR